jgi:hypothetical protein
MATVTMTMRPKLFCAPPLEEMLAACEKLSDQVSYERHQLLEQKPQTGEHVWEPNIHALAVGGIDHFIVWARSRLDHKILPSRFP